MWWSKLDVGLLATVWPMDATDWTALCSGSSNKAVESLSVSELSASKYFLALIEMRVLMLTFGIVFLERRNQLNRLMRLNSPGYRDWRLISAAYEAGNLNDLRAILGNVVAMKAYLEKKLPFLDGTIITRLAWKYIPVEENNKVFGRAQSFIAESATNVQFVVKDSRKYASTGGWGFAQFKDGEPADEAVHKTCFPCHEPFKARNFVFTYFAP
jgi:hypothetical protein